ncbi:hypothetical protein PQX77_016522 [Marasmius sp. AFHP31]|nr:hypothetical protein PQX77_016522 [Marasmius sp. AFHP31]
MSGYINPLHTPVHPSHISSFSSLGSAMTPPPSSKSHASRRHVPQTSYAPSSKWKNQTGRVQPLCASISFDFIGITHQGMPLRELCARGPYALQQMMQGANDAVFANAPSRPRKVTLHIRWPGYEHIEWVRTIEVVTASGHITRAQLAGVIAQNFARYVEVNIRPYQYFDSQQLTFWSSQKTQFEATTNIDWRLGPAGITFDHITLLSLRNVFEDAWQAEVAVDVR